LAVETGLWILYEVEKGPMKLTCRPKEMKPVEAYLSPQGRFSSLNSRQIAEIQMQIEEKWKLIVA